MSALSDIADTLWSQVISTGKSQAVSTIQAVISGAVKTAKGETPSVLAAIAQDHPDVLQAIEQLAQMGGSFVGGPLGGFAAKEIVELLANGHAMTPDEERAWMDRQGSSQAWGGSA